MKPTEKTFYKRAWTLKTVWTQSVNCVFSVTGSWCYSQWRLTLTGNCHFENVRRSRLRTEVKNVCSFSGCWGVFVWICNVVLQCKLLLYIELSNSFLIGRKRTVNFRKQHPWRHSCRLYNNHLKVTGSHVKFALRQWWSKNMTSIFFVQCIIKLSLDSVFVISRMIKVLVSRRLRLITVTEILIILDITKT